MEQQTKTLKQIIAEEYVRCSKDTVHLLKKYAKIQHPTRGKISFELFPFQENVVHELETNRLVIINKGRQLGLSTLVAGFILKNMLFTPDFKVLIIATKQDVAKNLVHKVKVMYDGLPSWLKTERIGNNYLSMEFKNGSSLKAVASSKDAGRSEGLSLLVIDEAAHIEQMEAIWTSAFSTTSTGGNVIMLSSPNGVGNVFHKIWTEAEAGGEFYPIRLPWYLHPERDQKWREEQDRVLGTRAAAQENDCDFITSGHTFLDGELILWYKQTYEAEPVEKRGFDKNYWLWDFPDPYRTYIVAADPASGEGEDNSAFVVVDAETMIQVAEYQGKIPTKQFGAFLVAVATEWNNAILIIDRVGVGFAVIQEVIDRHYENLYYHFKDDPYLDEYKHVTKRYDLQDKSRMVPGFSINTQTRPVILSKFDTYFREKIPVCKSVRSLNEFLTFIWLNGKPQARYGYHDDLTMCWAEVFWIRDTALKLKQLGMDMSRATLDSFNVSLYTPKDAINNPAYHLPVAPNEKEDLRWLF